MKFTKFVITMDILDSDILKLHFDQPTPHAGCLLLAEPLMRDDTFSRSVLVLIEHSDSLGSMGFVTNHISRYTLNELVAEIERSEDIPVYIGGPVHHDRLYYLHTLGDLIPQSESVCNGLYVSGDFRAMVEYINSGGEIEGKVRFFLGYSGWTKGQLEGEIKNYDWAVTTITDAKRLLTLQDEEAWRAEVQLLDERYRLWLNCPSYVGLN